MDFRVKITDVPSVRDHVAQHGKCLVNNLLLLNQFPDVDADRAVGRNTLPMRLGRSRCWLW